GGGRLRPRYVDCPGGAMSVEEFAGGVSQYQYSSIMDYGATFNSDNQGLGLYDKAAMKFAYAGDGYVEVFTKAKQDPDSRKRLAAMQHFSANFGFPSPIAIDTSSKTGQSTFTAVGYTTYPDLFDGGARAMYEREDVPYAEVLKASQTSDALVDSKNRM